MANYFPDNTRSNSKYKKNTEINIANIEFQMALTSENNVFSLKLLGRNKRTF